jgi:hypothetical protein
MIHLNGSKLNCDELNYSYKLIYSECRGQADLIKLLFAIADKKCEMIQIKQNEWSNYKLFMPFEQLPVLVINDKWRICQANTICRFLAKQFNLNGSNEIESVTCDMIVEQLKECANEAMNIVQETDTIRRNLFINNFKNGTLQRTLIGFEKMLNLNR